MSRRLGTDKRPNGQTLHSLDSFAHVRDTKEPGGPKGRGRGSRHSEDADSPLPRGATSPVRSPQHNAHFSPHPETTDFRKSLHKNVFIDSYYPVVQGDCSEAGRNSHSIYEEIHKHGISTEDSWDTDSGEASQNICTTNSNSVDPRPANVLNRSKRSSTTLATTSPTFDSGTYTILSCSSDLDSTFVNISHPPNEEISGNAVPDDDRPPPSAVGCFTQLYHRIHNLEDMLQQTIVQSVQPKETKGTKPISGGREKPKQAKKKFPGLKKQTAGMGKTWESTCLSIPEASDEKANSDTDNELRNIKKRLRVLERKLRRTKQPSPPPSPTCCLHRDPNEPLTSSSLVFTGMGGEGCKSSRDMDSTVPLLSETESFLQSEVFLLNSASCERSEGDSCDKKAKTKVRRKFISKCRGIRNKCSGIVSSSRKIYSKNNPLKVSTTSGWSEVLYKRSILTEESVAATLLSQSFSTHTRTDSSTVLYLSCQHEGLLEPPRTPRKKNRKKRKYLCKKNSKMDILSVHCVDNPAKELLLTSTPTAKAFVFGDCNLPPTATLQICATHKKPAVFDKNTWTANPDSDEPTWEPHRLWIPFQQKFCNRQPQEAPDCTLKAAKPPKNRISFRNPLDILKQAGKLKIPVLFEEVCKTPDPKEPGHRLSKVSMRFVVVEEDSGHPLTPLRRLINRLSQAKAPHKAEQFVFGVSKCRCDGQVQGLKSISQRDVTSGFS